MKKLFVFVMLLMMMALTACSNNNTIDLAPDADVDYISFVQGARPFYGDDGIDVTLERVVNRFFDSPTWYYNRLENWADVEVHGSLKGFGESISIVSTVTPFAGGVTSLSFSSVSIDGEAVASTDEDVREFLRSMFESYELGYEHFTF